MGTIRFLLAMAVVLAHAGSIWGYTLIEGRIAVQIILIASNLFIFGQDLIMFMAVNPDTGVTEWTSNFRHSAPALYNLSLVPQAWSVGIELCFYLAAPFLFRLKVSWVILILIPSIITRFLYKKGLNFDPWNYRLFPTELALFILGHMSYIIYQKKIFNNTAVNQILFFVICLSILTWNYISFPGFLILLYAFVTVSIPFVFQFTKSSSLDAKIGDLSYLIYISHFFIINFISLFKIEKKNLNNIVILISTVVFAFVLNKFIADKIETVR